MNQTSNVNWVPGLAVKTRARGYRHRLAIILLALALLGSVALNGFLFWQGRQYYRSLNANQLDPLGLDVYASAEEPSPVSDQIRVVFFGDSRASMWPAPDLADYQFINRGIGNQTSAQTLGRFDRDVAPLQPQIVIVQVGINDLKTIPLFPEQQAAIVADCEANIRQIVEGARTLEATVILTTLFPLGEIPLERRPFWSPAVGGAVNEVNDFIRSLAGDGSIVLDAVPILADESGTARREYSRDLLHYNAAGYEALNVALKEVLAQLKS